MVWRDFNINNWMRVEWPKRSLLGGVQPAPRAALFSAGTPHEYAAGQTIFLEATRSTGTVLVLDGKVKISRDPVAGRTTLIDIKGRGDVLGEMAALTGEPRRATAVASDTARCLVVDKGAFDRILRAHPTVKDALLNVFIERQDWADRRRIDCNGRPVLARVAGVLDELADAHGRHVTDGILVDVSLTQRELGELVGACERRTGDSLRALTNSGAIVRQYQKFVVVDRALLRSTADDGGTR